MDEQQKREDLWGWGMEREKAMDAQYILIVYYNYYIYIYIYKPQSINKTLIKLEISKGSFFFFTLLYFIFSFTFWTLQGCLFFLKSFLLFKLLLDHTSALWRIQHISFPVASKLNNINSNNKNDKKKRQEVDQMERRLSLHSFRQRSRGGDDTFKSPRWLKPWSTKTCCSHRKDSVSPFDPVYVEKEAEMCSATFTQFLTLLWNVHLVKNTQNPSR